MLITHKDNVLQVSAPGVPVAVLYFQGGAW